jgi:hypothetical protein
VTETVIGRRGRDAINAAIEVLGKPWSMLAARREFGDRRHFRGPG